MSMHTKRPNKGRGSGRVRGWLELSLFARERFTTMASTANVASHVGGKRLRVCGCMYVLLDPNEGTAHVKKTRSFGGAVPRQQEALSQCHFARTVERRSSCEGGRPE